MVTMPCVGSGLSRRESVLPAVPLAEGWAGSTPSMRVKAEEPLPGSGCCASYQWQPLRVIMPTEARRTYNRTPKNMLHSTLYGETGSSRGCPDGYPYHAMQGRSRIYPLLVQWYLV